MRALVVFAAVALLANPAMAGSNLAPGDPTFGQFETSCRHGTDLDADCRGSVLGAYAEQAKTTPDKVTCDYAAFWKTKDDKYAGRVSSVIPWQDAVTMIVAEPGVCRAL